nr:unnamed protein product [Callosobruchus analis]
MVHSTNIVTRHWSTPKMQRRTGSDSTGAEDSTMSKPKLV